MTGTQAPPTEGTSVRYREAQTLEGARYREQDDGDYAVFSDVAVLGLESKNLASNGEPRRYSAEAVQGAVDLYEGARVFIGHTDPWDKPDPERLVGKIVGVSWDAAAQKLRARELRVLRGERTGHVVSVLRHQPEHVALSHDVAGVEDAEEGIIVAIMEVASVDLVVHGGTNDNLYESAGKGLAFRVDPDAARDGCRVQAGDGSWWHIAPVGTTETDMGDTPKNDKGLEGRVAALEARTQEAEANAEKAEARAAQAEQDRANVALVYESELPEASRKALAGTVVGMTEDQAKAAISGKVDELKALGVLDEDGKVRKTETTDAGEDGGRTVEHAGADTDTGGAKPPKDGGNRDAELQAVSESMGRMLGLDDDSVKEYAK